MGWEVFETGLLKVSAGYLFAIIVFIPLKDFIIITALDKDVGFKKCVCDLGTPASHRAPAA